MIRKLVDVLITRINFKHIFNIFVVPSPEVEAELAACQTKMLEFQAKVEGK